MFLWISITSIGTFLLILIYLLIGIIQHKPKFSDQDSFISVIVCAHNEQDTIINCLDALLSQTYAQDKTEIIVVNDRSTDNTGDVISEYIHRHPNLKIISINDKIEGLSPKKYALSQGIAVAKGNIILTTDADCIPPKNWIKIITSYFTKETGMVVGMAPLASTSWWLSSFISMDALTADILAYGSLGWGHAVACAGRNFAYRKSVFMEVNGFSGINHIITGDDDLFLQKVAKMTNWKIQFSPELESSVPSNAPSGWAHFIAQRKRHISGAKYFSLPIQLGYALYFFSKLFIMVTFIILLTNNIGFYIPSLLFLLSYFPAAIFISVMARKTNQIYLIIYYPLWEIYYLLSHIFLGPLGLFGKISWGKRHFE